MTKFQAGQKVRVIADTFKDDPHGLEIGTVVTIDKVVPATKFKDFPPFIQLMIVMNGQKPHDLPERLHVKLNNPKNPFQNFANLVFEDVELIPEEGSKVRMLEDDWCEGYSKGDVFEVHYDNEGYSYFIDKDGDKRFLTDNAHEVI